MACAIRAGVDGNRLLVELGRLFYDMKQYDRAAELLRQAVVNAPGDRQAHLALGHVCLKQGRVQEAQRYFEQAGRRMSETRKRSSDGKSP